MGHRPGQRGSDGLERDATPKLLERSTTVFRKQWFLEELCPACRVGVRLATHLPTLFPREPDFLLWPGACTEDIWLLVALTGTLPPR